MLLQNFALLCFTIIWNVHLSIATASVELFLQSYSYPWKISEVTGNNCDSNFLWSYDCSPIFYFCINEGDVPRSCTSEAIKLGPYRRVASIDFSKEHSLEFHLDKFSSETKLFVNVEQNWKTFLISYAEVQLKNVSTPAYIPGRNRASSRLPLITLTGPKDYMKLELRFRVWCNPNCYGEECNVYCDAQDSSDGHYYCSEKGDKICRSGWIKPESNCTIEDNFCNSMNPCENGAICVPLNQTDYYCNCTENFTGKNCTDISTTTENILSTLVTTTTTRVSTTESSPSDKVSTQMTTNGGSHPSHSHISSDYYTTDSQSITTLSKQSTTQKYYAKDLMVNGHLSLEQQATMEKRLKSILVNEMKLNESEFHLKTSFKYRQAKLDGSDVTVISIDASSKGKSIPHQLIIGYLFQHGEEWLSNQISHTVYTGDLKQEESLNTKDPDEQSIGIILGIICSVVILLVLSIVFIFIYKAYMKKRRMKHARQISSHFGVQFTRNSEGFRVNINDDKVEVENNPIYCSPSEYDEPSRYIERLKY